MTDSNSRVCDTDNVILDSSTNTHKLNISGNDCKVGQTEIEIQPKHCDTTINDGYAHIKEEYVVPNISSEQNYMVNSESPPPKKAKLSGKNHKRPKLIKAPKSSKLCKSYWSILPTEEPNENKCTFENCAFSHNIEEFLKNKPKDLGTNCYNYEVNGYCQYGFTCRYGVSHIDGLKCKVIKEKFVQNPQTSNNLERQVQISLRKKNYDFSAAQKASENARSRIKASNQTKRDEGACINASENKSDSDQRNGNAILQPIELEETSKEKNELSCENFVPVKSNLREKKKIDWNNLLYLAPLTTLGNLPFRRVCRRLGADVTCSEMAVAINILQGHNSEWALVKRHESEKLFGVQLCGSNADAMVKCAQVLEDQISMDFVDINMGCPIDLIFKQGAGSALMRRVNVLEQMVFGMNDVLSCPVTLKMRTSIYNRSQIAHEIIRKAKLWDVNMFTVHGRTKEQRYLKEPDWVYIDQCAREAAPVPLYGNGDVLTYDDYMRHKEQSSVDGIMFARGALIKPWIFTEVKEKRTWDISANERLDILKEFANYGLEHWGSDSEGVEKTRRFLLEWLSFLYRYIPVGLLDQPQKMNQRPPAYIGRNDLETLMASTKVNDWVKISEMLLGPVPADFQFLPKHKANSWT